MFLFGCKDSSRTVQFYERVDYRRLLLQLDRLRTGQREYAERRLQLSEAKRDLERLERDHERDNDCLLQIGEMMNSGTIIRTVLAIATCLNTALLATDVAQFGNEKVDEAYKIISVNTGIKSMQL